MAKTRTIGTDLFNGERRQIQFKGGPHVLLDAKDKKHTRLKVKMPLTGEPLKGMPEFIIEAYTAMQKNGAAENFTGYDRFMEGMSAALFSTPEMKTKLLKLTACEIDHFSIEKSGVGDDAIVSLHFDIDVLGHKELYDMMWDYHNAGCFVEFEYNQADIPFKEKKAEDE